MLIFIIGPTASGKTTIGQKLAKFLKINFIDIDSEIEKRSGVAVSWIFEIGFFPFQDKIVLSIPFCFNINFTLRDSLNASDLIL